jgi:hypothetical protein
MPTQMMFNTFAMILIIGIIACMAVWAIVTEHSKGSNIE